ncbi:hypothetical protein [Nocardia sp. Marseille-Q1738]
MRQRDPTHANWDIAHLMSHIEAIDRLVADVRAERVRLPEEATDVFPPKTARADEPVAESDTFRNQSDA